MSKWKVSGRRAALSIQPLEAVRQLGDESFTWANLMYEKLRSLQVLVVYFPSRFDNNIDLNCKKWLRNFGKETGSKTSVNFWDPKDTYFEDALKLFGVKSNPAVVLVTGLQVPLLDEKGPDKTELYSISFADQTVLTNEAQFQNGVNRAHQILMLGNPKDIASFVRGQNAKGVLKVIGGILGKVRDQLVILKPTFTLPNGVSLGLGG